ncbi:MAG: 30S ribosomal protein S3 [Candidatus Zixiibacteriota bacterium]|nr:MAG: 30S ribosomal protein S3 [candidate division Zixibacteria bacterium]
MGQKTHPIGFRLGIIKTWSSRWYAPDSKFADLIYEDMMVKRYIDRRLDNAGIAKVNISRAPKKVTVDIHTSRPGIVIGRKGSEVDKLREELQLLTKKDILLNIVEVRKPELDARLVADTISRQLVGRIAFRRAMKKAIAATMRMGADGIKIQCSGRLGGAEIARDEKYQEGRVPLHTLRADIDYATSTAHTTYGCIGVKVWICRGEILEQGDFYKDEKDDSKSQDAAAPSHSGRKRKPSRDNRSKRPRGRVRKPGSERYAPKGRRPDATSPANKGASDRGGAKPNAKSQNNKTGKKPAEKKEAPKNKSEE